MCPNAYAYVRSRPTVLRDPLGREDAEGDDLATALFMQALDRVADAIEAYTGIPVASAWTVYQWLEPVYRLYRRIGRVLARCTICCRFRVHLKNEGPNVSATLTWTQPRTGEESVQGAARGSLWRGWSEYPSPCVFECDKDVTVQLRAGRDSDTITVKPTERCPCER